MHVRRSLDFHVLMTLISRCWSVVAGATTLILIPMGLDQELQGFYFTFASLLTLQVFLELGFGQIIIQLVSHETAHLKRHGGSSWIGPTEHLEKLEALTQLLDRWYTFAAITFIVVVGFCGWVFFSLRSSSNFINWSAPWVAVVLATGLNLWLSPRLAFNEGMGYVGQVASLRLVQSVLGYCTLWLGLIFGLGLWCSVAVPLASGVASWYWLKTNGRIPQWSKANNIKKSLSWRRDILPMQWRMALSWISGFFIFNLFTPVTFSLWGASEAGRLGIALMAFSSITTIGMSWVSSKFHMMGQLVARKDFAQLDLIFTSSMWKAICFNAVIATSFAFFIGVSDFMNLAWAKRIADVEVLLILAFVCIVNTAIFSMASYMRAHQKEPMLFVSLASALFTVLAITIFNSSITEMMIAYSFINLFLSLPWTIFLFRKCRMSHKFG